MESRPQSENDRPVSSISIEAERVTVYGNAARECTYQVNRRSLSRGIYSTCLDISKCDTQSDQFALSTALLSRLLGTTLSVLVFKLYETKYVEA